MINTKLKLLVYTIQNQQIRLLSNHLEIFDPPSVNLSTLDTSKTIGDIDHLLKILLGQYTQISNNWTDMKFVDIHLYQTLDNDLNMDIYYMVYLPTEAVFKHSYWINLDIILYKFPILKKIICLI